MIRKKKQSAYEQFMTLSDPERERAVARYDNEDLTPGKPLTATDKAQHRRAARRAKRGRPQIGKGTKMVPITIERGFLKDVDSFAKQHGFKRSQMVVQGLRLLMQQEPKAKAG